MTERDRELILEEINKIDKESYYYYFYKLIVEGDLVHSDFIFYILIRNVFLELKYRGKMIKPDFHTEKINIVYKNFTEMILSDKTFKMGVANIIEKYDLVKMVRQIFSYLNKEDCLINSDYVGNLVMATEYLYYRYLEKKKVSNAYPKEIGIIFGITESEMNNCNINAIGRLKNDNFENIIYRLNNQGKWARKYINGMWHKDPMLARILEDWLALLGHDNLGRFLILYEGLDFKFPKIWDVLEKKDV